MTCLGMTSRGHAPSPMSKCTSERADCAPKYLSAGTSILPIESDSTRVAAFSTIPILSTFSGGAQYVNCRSCGAHLDDLVDRQRIARVETAFVAARAARGLARAVAAQRLEGAPFAAEDVALTRFPRRRNAAEVVIDRLQAAIAQLALEARAVSGVAEFGVAPRVHHLVEKRIRQRLGMLLEMLG